MQSRGQSNFEGDAIVWDLKMGCLRIVGGLLSGIFFLNLQLWQLVILQPINLQRPIGPLWKYLRLFKIIQKNQKEYQDL